jgi:hypothetical protein
MRLARMVFSVLVVAVVVAVVPAGVAVLGGPAGAVEIVGSGNVEIVSMTCATLQCNTVADGGGLRVISYDAGPDGPLTTYAAGTRVRVRATDDVTLGVAGVAQGISVGTSPEVITFGGATWGGIQPSADAGASTIYCKSTSGTPTVNICPVLPGLGGR